MHFVEFIVAADDDGKRFDRIARCVVSGAKLSSLYKEIRKGLVKLNGKKASPETRVKAGDKITVADFLLQDSCVFSGSENILAESEFPFSVIFKNEAVLVIDKPYDVSVQPSSQDAESVSKIVADFSKNTSLSFTPAPLHRLDKRTTGILVCSQNIEGARWFSEQMSAHKIIKTYIALVEGDLKKTETWQDDILNDAESAGGKNRFHTVATSPLDSKAMKSQNAKRAVTKATPVSNGSYKGLPVSLVSFEIQTGRKHQIRAQAASHGFPLLCDTAYGARALPFGQKLYLHAWKICFPANSLDIPRELTAPVPEKFQKILPSLLIDFI